MVQTYECVFFLDSVIIDNDDDDRIFVLYRCMNAYFRGDSVIIDNEDDDRIFVWYRRMNVYFFGIQLLLMIFFWGDSVSIDVNGRFSV